MNVDEGESFSEFHHLLSDIVNGLVAEGFEEHSLRKGKTFNGMVRWRNEKLVKMLRVLEHLPQDDGASSTMACDPSNTVL